MDLLYNLLAENSFASVALLFVLIVLGKCRIKNTEEEDHYNNLNS